MSDRLAMTRSITQRSHRRRWRLSLASLVIIGVVMGLASSAEAHPLGNFTVNRYARIEVAADTVRIYYVLDEAELPAFQERAAVAADPDGFTAKRVADIATNLTLEVDGTKLPLTVDATSLDQPEGQAGLKTLRVAAIYSARLGRVSATSRHNLVFEDRNDPDRIGWREIVGMARGNAKIISTNAPQEDVSDELRTYPGDLIQAPLDLRRLEMTFIPGTQSVAAAPLPRSAPPPTRAGGQFADLLNRESVGAGALIALLGAAFLLGAGHAVLPGHGKTVMGAYLIGTKGRPLDAVLLGLIVSFMHTASVLILGLILFRVNRSFALDRIYPALTLASGLLAMAFGGWLLNGRLKQLRARRTLATDHDHSHDHHEHSHEHHEHHDHHEHEPAAVLAPALGVTGPVGPVTAVLTGGIVHRTASDHLEHGHDHPHHDHPHPDDPPSGHSHGAHQPSEHEHDVASNGGHSRLSGLVHNHGPGGHTHELPEDVAPLTRRGLVVIATSGGIVPSPSAVVVVVSAFSLGRAALGLSLIAAFSVGLAATLTGIGLGLVYGRTVIERRWPARSIQFLPVVGAVALMGLGLVLALRGLFQF